MPGLREVVQHLVKRDGVDAVMVVSADGLVIDHASRSGIDTDAVAAMLPALTQSAKQVGEGSLIFTNRRLVLKIGNRIAAVKYAPGAQIHLYSDGIRLQKTIGNTLLKFRSGSEETGEIVGELLSALMR